MDITPWHLLAFLYQQDELSLPEIVKLCIINQTIGLIEDTGDTIRIGYDFFENSALYDALTIGLLSYPNPPLQVDMSKILKLTPKTIGNVMKRLQEKKHVTKWGIQYRLTDDLPALPLWVFRFTEGLADLHFKRELAEYVIQTYGEIHFKRGLELVRAEMRRKYYHPRKT
jgi:hypothetical protein